MNPILTHVIVGGGAAGFFGAITCAQHFPHHRVIILEKTRQLLSKVRISGGGRCNVTHACFDPTQLIKNYPRGNRELRGPFTHFQPQNTIEWFEKRGVKLKKEEDGRMFPQTDRSETIIDCLLSEAKRLGVDIHLESGIQEICVKEEKKFLVKLAQEKQLECDRLLVATGSTPKMYPLLQQLGHTLIPLVPSLFTFNLPGSSFLDLAGISVAQVEVQLPEWNFKQQGPLLLTHWGLSGPAVLKLSAWAARELHDVNYRTTVYVNWLPTLKEEELKAELRNAKQKNAKKQIGVEALFGLPKQLWKRLVHLSDIMEEQRWAELSSVQLNQFVKHLQQTTLKMEGKTGYKQEFVTCGGIDLKEVNFKTMESRKCPGLYFAGEVLNIDGVTGGFNFQNAWTTGWLAGRAMGL